MSYKVVWTTDWHIADHPPENRIDDYTEACFQKIEQIRLICEKIEADLCLVGGDIFHVKISAKVRHALVARLIGVLNSFPCPVWTIVGNHDISHNNMSTLPEKPLGVVLESGAMSKMDDRTFVKGDTSVRVVGRHFDPRVELDAFDGIVRGDETWLLVAFHGYASPQGISYPGETTFRYDELSKLPVDDWYFGHWHVDQGVQEVGGKHFVNVGSLTRGALTLENVTRTPKVVVAVYSKDSRKIRQIRLKVDPAEHVFDMAKKERTDREQALINEFIQNLRKETAQPSQGNDNIIERLEGYKLAKDVRECVVELLEESEIELQSSRAGR